MGWWVGRLGAQSSLVLDFFGIFFNLAKPLRLGELKPASHDKLIRRFRLSRRCCGSCRDFRLATGTLRLADNWIGDPSAKTKPATPFPDHWMTKKCPTCDKIVNFRPILYVNKAHHYPLSLRKPTYYRTQNGMMQSIFCTSKGAIDDGMTAL